MKIQCEQCGREYEVEESANGEIVECECGYKWRLPEKEVKKPAVPKPPTAKEPPRAGAPQPPEAEKETFVAPKIVNWICGIGTVTATLGVCGFVLGIVITCLDGSKNLSFAFLSIPAVVSGIFIIGFGTALEYLARIALNTREIALNTRKK